MEPLAALGRPKRRLWHPVRYQEASFQPPRVCAVLGYTECFHTEVPGAGAACCSRGRENNSKVLPRKRRGTHKPNRREETQRSPVSAKGEGETHKVQRTRFARGRRRKHHGQRVSRSDQAKVENTAEKTRGPEGGEDTDRRAKVVPGGGKTPWSSRTTGGNRERSRPDKEQQGTVQTGRSQTVKKQKGVVPFRVVSSVAFLREYTHQEHRFHGCRFNSGSVSRS